MRIANTNSSKWIIKKTSCSREISVAGGEGYVVVFIPEAKEIQS